MIKSRKYHVYLALIGVAALFCMPGSAAAAELNCSAANYCATELTLSKQKAPIIYDGTGAWLDSFARYFDAEVSVKSGADSVPLTDAKMIYACSTDGMTFGSCQEKPFIEVGSYILRVSVEEDQERFYLPAYADTVLTLTESQSAAGLTITYQSGSAPTGAAPTETPTEAATESLTETPADPAADSEIKPTPEALPETAPEEEPLSDPDAVTGSAVVDPTVYAAGDEAIILGNLGLDPNGNPDPLVKEGYQLTGWKDIETNETYELGELVPMVRSLVLVPIWTSEAEAAASDVDANDAAPAPEAARPAPTATIDPALLAKAVPFYPVTSDGAEAAPRLLIDGQTIAVAEPDFEEDPAANARRVLDGFYAPDGDPFPVSVGGMPIDPALQSKSPADQTTPTENGALQPKSPDFQFGANFGTLDWDITAVTLPHTGFSTLRQPSARQAGEPSALTSVQMKLEIPQFNVMTEIVRVPFTGTSWDVSDLRGEAGLLEGFDLPGEGVSLIAGHNHLGPDQVGPFIAIGSLNTGDRIFVHREGSPLLTFEIFENRLLEPNAFESIEALVAEHAGAIVLITCENETTEGTYSDRRVVFAKMITD